MQQTTHCQPVIFSKASGINDIVSPVKMDHGYTQFALNLDASRDVWKRRFGRDFSAYTSGLVLGIFQVEWSDGEINQIAQMGSAFYDIISNFKYLFPVGLRYINQASDGQYWDCTPNVTTGLINPTPISAPSGAAQTGNVFVSYTENIGFKTTSGTTVLKASNVHFGWYLDLVDVVVDTANVGSDMIFSDASGFHLQKEDENGNVWEMRIADSGNLYSVTI